jgi:hypothetical protein|tara:strand:+ start:295 stop:726 length:432 start_codon:yes stop_codon:yes gene_type:complete
MTAAELREKIRVLIPQVYANVKQGEEAAVEFDELTKFPELKAVIVDLLSHEFDNFLASIDWVAPKPSTFRINLKNDQDFYLTYSRTSWIAQVEGKKYYLLNLPEEERATEAIARILRYGVKADTEAVDGEDNVDIDVDDTVEI